MVLLSISGGRPTRVLLLQLTHPLAPSRSPHAVFVIRQAAAATLDTQNTIMPPSSVN